MFRGEDINVTLDLIIPGAVLITKFHKSLTDGQINEKISGKLNNIINMYNKLIPSGINIIICHDTDFSKNNKTEFIDKFKEKVLLNNQIYGVDGDQIIHSGQTRKIIFINKCDEIKPANFIYFTRKGSVLKTFFYGEKQMIHNNIWKKNPLYMDHESYNSLCAFSDIKDMTLIHELDIRLHTKNNHPYNQFRCELKFADTSKRKYQIQELLTSTQICIFQYFILVCAKNKVNKRSHPINLIPGYTFKCTNCNTIKKIKYINHNEICRHCI